MKRWSTSKDDEVEAPEIDAFLADIKAVCIKHSLSIVHEDGQGAFEIARYDPCWFEWLSNAHDAREDPTYGGPKS